MVHHNVIVVGYLNLQNSSINNTGSRSFILILFEFEGFPFLAKQSYGNKRKEINLKPETISGVLLNAERYI